MIKGIHHIAIKCADTTQFDKVVAFYNEILGMPILRKWGEGDAAGIMIDTGTGVMEIFASGGDTLGYGSVRHFALATDDVDGCIAAVRDAGYEITMEPTDIVIPAEVPFPARIAFCKGAAGEEIEFFCEK